MLRVFFILMIGQCLWTPASAVIGGHVPSEAHSEVFQVEARSGSWSRICTATAVSPRHLLTAAHCFEHVVDLKSENFKFFINGTPVVQKFRLHQSSEFKSRGTSDDYLNQSNFDVALLEFRKPRFLTWKILSLDATPDFNEGQFLGFGMRTISWTKHLGIQESQRGQLQSATITIKYLNDGIINSIASLLQIRTGKDPIRISGSGQILRSDSGGPLLVQGKIVAIARNSVFRQKPSPDSESQHLWDLESQFTNLSHPTVAKFLKTLLP